ncbi:MAG TPA: CHAT domain-containing protein, partial [Mycobacterium sp.]
EASLIVDRDHPESARVPIKVRSKPDEGAAPRILEVSYEYAGAVVGRTWVQILVVAGAPEQTAEAAVGSAGSPPVLPAGDTPHLSIDVFSRPGDPELQWRFHCKYPDVTRPDDVSKTVNYGSPQAFALQMMQQVPAASSGAFVRQTMAGFGRDVADALPGDFWPIFFETWRLARASGEEPRMLLTTSESWIPWELAWISQDRLPQGVSDLLGPDVGKGATLGQLWQVGRWAMPTQPQPTGPVPASPPASSVDANDMVVIIGKYEGDATVNPLPYAEDEGTTLATEYGGLPLDVSSETIAALMGCEYQRNGSDFRPTVIHFAGHGQTDVNNPQFTGLLLNGGKRLDPAVIRGFDLVSATQPFVFLNACEAGVASETLAHLGGLVGAFLAEGTRAFIAPLWKVDDVEARDIALAFYKSVLVDGMSVGAAMQDIRRRFTAASTSATALAYVFYGNPNLVLKRGVA